MAVWAGEADFLDLLAADADVSARLDRAQLAGLFRLEDYLFRVDEIFARVFGADTGAA